MRNTIPSFRNTDVFPDFLLILCNFNNIFYQFFFSPSECQFLCFKAANEMASTPWQYCGILLFRGLSLFFGHVAFPHLTVKDGLTGKRGDEGGQRWGQRHPCVSRVPYRPHQRHQLGLTGNSSKGLGLYGVIEITCSRSPMQLFLFAISKVPQDLGGGWWSTALGFIPALTRAPKPAQTRGDRALSRSRPRRGWTWNQRPPPPPPPQAAAAAAAAAAAEAPEEVVSDRTGLRARARGGGGARLHKPRAAQRAGPGGSVSRRAPGAADTPAGPGARRREPAGDAGAGGAGPPSDLSWLPPVFEGRPGLRHPQRPAEVKRAAAAGGGGGPGRVGRAGRLQPR